MYFNDHGVWTGGHDVITISGSCGIWRLRTLGTRGGIGRVFERMFLSSRRAWADAKGPIQNHPTDYPNGIYGRVPGYTCSIENKHSYL